MGAECRYSTINKGMAYLTPLQQTWEILSWECYFRKVETFLCSLFPVFSLVIIVSKIQHRLFKSLYEFE